jgi:predicted  nucleic acid-binding Zn-ribbon protein
MQERWSSMEAAVSAAREEAESAAAAAAKADAELGALSTAYNGLEQHAFDMEEQLRQLQEQQQQSAAAAAAAAAGGGLSEADVQARIQAALEQVRWLCFSLRLCAIVFADPDC